MTNDAREELILRHLDGETTQQEGAQVTRLLGEDADFRSRFFVFANLIADLQEIVSLGVSVGATPGVRPGGSPTDMAAILALKPPKAAARPLADLNLDFKRIYLNAVAGGIGGLLGWLVISLLGAMVALSSFNVYLRDAVIGPLVGVCIGFAVGGSEGLFGARSLRRMWHGGRYGAVLGALGGLLGLVMGEFCFNRFGGGVVPRALGWGLFGMLVGISEGVVYRMPVKVRYGILGGLLGGLIGGSTYECLVSMFRGGASLAWGSAIGLVILGACIGFLVSLVESLLRKAWLFFVTGRLEGQTRTLDSSRPHTLGSDPACTIVLPHDPSVAAVHAEILFEEGEFQVRARDGQVVVRHDGIDQTVAAHVLAPGDRVFLGDTRMVFRNVEGKKS